MEDLFPYIFGIGIVFAVAIGIYGLFQQSQESDTTAELNMILVQNSSLRGEIVRLESELSQSPKNSLRKREYDPNKYIECIFCIEYIPRDALVCSYCRRGNVHNINGIIEKEIQLIKKTRNGDII